VEGARGERNCSYEICSCCHKRNVSSDNFTVFLSFIWMVAVVAAGKAGGKACVRGDARDLWWPRNSVNSKPMITYQRLIQHNRKWQVLQVYNSSPSISLLGLAVSVQPILPEARSPSFEELIDPGAAILQKAVW